MRARGLHERGYACGPRTLTRRTVTDSAGLRKMRVNEPHES